MKGLQTLLVSLLALSLLALPAAAQPTFTVTLEPAVAVVNIGEQTEFTLTLSHTSPNAETFEVYSSDVLWDLHTADTLIIPASGKLQTKLYIRPLQVNPGFYRVPLSVRLAKSGIVQEQVLSIELRSKDQPLRGYVPAPQGSFSLPGSVDPRQPIPITVRLENKNPRNLTNLVLKFRSGLINKDFTASLDPLAKKSFQFEIPLDPLARPQADILKLSVIASADGVTYQFDFPAQEYSIASYGGISEDVKDTKYFLGRTRVLALRNTGNAQYAKRVTLPVNFLARLFSSASVKGEWGAGAYGWDVSLNPAEERSITVRTNYWPPFIVIVLAALAVLAYYLFRSPLVIVKRAMVLAAKEGGISELKVILALKNRSPHAVNHVHLIDVVPNIAEVSRETELGSIAPLQVLRHEKKGTLVKWKLEHLEGHEERIITYQIRSKLGILGGLKLPEALARFESPGGERTVRSNMPSLVVGARVCR